MRTRLLLLVGCLVALFALPAVARAQGPTTDPSTAPPNPADEVAAARFHLGPLGFSPTIVVGNVGVNTNVFNTPTDPTSDFTFTVTPGTQEVMHVGRLLFTGATDVPVTYFAQSTSQRSVGFRQQGRVDLNLIHFIPYASIVHSSTNEQPDPEIAVRVQQVMTAQTAGAVIRFSARTTFDANYAWGSYGFPNADVLGEDIGAVLDRQTSSINGTFRTELTPLTTVVVTGSLEHDRFSSNPFLNSNSLSLVPGLEFKPDARLSGKFSLGVRALRPLSPDVPRFTGIVGASSLSWLARDSTRLTGTFSRNVDYSLDETTPYFLLTSTSISISQLVVGHVDATVGTGRAWLGYRDQITGSSSDSLGREDRTDTLTVGAGYRFRIDARIGFNVSYAERMSSIDTNRYKGFLFGGTVNYGF